ncbi:hypothetical protein [Halorientalis halophila]|uniref:hypothetical protein n=1 Tax=Halorientalis halophila TaxID=3108499 RepID=UPI00300B1162
MLSAIPGPVVLAAVLGVALGVPLPIALALGSLPAGVVMGYALFWEPPVGGLRSSDENRENREPRDRA